MRHRHGRNGSIRHGLRRSPCPSTTRLQLLDRPGRGSGGPPRQGRRGAEDRRDVRGLLPISRRHPRQSGRLDWRAKAYADAVALAPDLPAGYYSWGAALARHGDLAGAEAKLKDANKRGPHWADPLKAWGDVLVKQGKTKRRSRNTMRRSNTRRTGGSLKKRARRWRCRKADFGA